DPETDKSWTYHIPDTDPIYRYELSYDTDVNMDGQEETVVVENTATGKGGIDSDRAVLPPPGAPGFDIKKQATDVSSTGVTWEITVTVAGTALDYERLVLKEHSGLKTSSNNPPTWAYEYIPSKYMEINGEKKWYKESLVKVEVIGLDENETFVVTYGRYDDQNKWQTFPGTGGGEILTAATGAQVLETYFSNSQNTSQWSPDYFSMEFFHTNDEAQQVGNLSKPDGESPSRTVTVRLTTSFPEDWATKAREFLRQNQSIDIHAYSHINWISVETPGPDGTLTTRAFDTDKISPMPPYVYKTVLNQSDGGADSSLAEEKKKMDSYILSWPNPTVKSDREVGSETGKNHRGEPIFPCFHYQVLVTGIQYDEPIVIEDSFDTSLFDIIVVSDNFPGGRYVMTWESKKWTHNYFPKVFGTMNFSSSLSTGQSNYDLTNPDSVLMGFGYNNTNWYRKAEDYDCTFEKTDTGFRVTIEKPFRNVNGDLYPIYGIDYWLIPKDLAALKTIEEMAKANGQATGEPKAPFTNTASSRGISASTTVKIHALNNFMPIDKTSQTFVELTGGDRVQMDDTETGRTIPEGVKKDDIARYVMHYHIVLNKGKERLNDGNSIVAEDEFSDNLSVDYRSIQITTDPADAAAQVSYDYSGNVGTFVIPDETMVIIDYDALLIPSEGTGTRSVSNTVRMLQYTKTLGDNVEYGGAMAGSATNPSILLKKYGSGHMEAPGLNGAVFQLYEYHQDNLDRPTRYQKGDPLAKDNFSPMFYPDGESIITFETANLQDYGDGYAEIELIQEFHGTTLQPKKTYGLREVTAPRGTAANGDTIQYQLPHNDASFYCYVFTIDSSADYGSYVFMQDDIMKVSNTPQGLGLHFNKHLDGNCTLSDQEKAKLHYQLFAKRQPAEGEEAVYMPIMTTVTDPDTGESSEEPDGRFQNITYAQIAEKCGTSLHGLTIESGAEAGEYLLVEYGSDEILAAHPDWSWRGTYVENNGIERTFSNSMQTVYDADGKNAQQVYGIPFTVTSDNIRYAEDKTLTLTNSYTRETVNLTATKRWQGPDGSGMAWPSGKSVVFTLGTVADGVFTPVPDVSPVTLDYGKDQNGEDSPGVASFKNLPKYEVVELDGVQKKQPIHYAVWEDAIGGYTVVYPGNATYATLDETAGAVICNRMESTSVTVSKAWEDNIPDNATVTFRLYACTDSAPTPAWVSNVNDIVLDGVADEGTFGELAAWQASFTGLPKYSGSEEIHYLVKEIACSVPGYEPVQEFAADGGTITNGRAALSFRVQKVWSGTPGDAWPEGVQITLRLVRATKTGTPDAAFFADYVIGKKADTGEIEVLSQSKIHDPYGEERTDSGVWDEEESTLTVSHLPKFDGSGNELRYYAMEIAVKNAAGDDLSGQFQTSYKTANNYNSDRADSGGKVVNASSSKALSISKTVDGNQADRTRSFHFKVDLSSGGSAYSGAVAYTGPAQAEDDGGKLSFVNGTAVICLKHGESLTLQNLSGSLSYTVTETDAADYQTTCSVNGATASATTTVSGSLSDDPELAFTNARQVEVPTGLRFETALFAAALPLSALAMYLLLRRRKEE
ncbi:MAG: Cna B-type domain-containing protein, partial [Oscillospiraceae bacterium]|nr:Cna B-type domain-containing protein [Oscillospiraceae bacterium]